MKITVSFFATMLILSLAISGAYNAIIPLIAATLHEAAHVIAAKARGVRLKKFDVGIFGARLTMSEGIYSYADEIVICAAGPLVNLFSAGICICICNVGGIESELFSLFILSSIALGVINLLPVRSFDGGRILLSALSYIITSSSAEKFLSFISADGDIKK